jgi:Kelch motif/Galactose oxidase, central domain
MNDNVDFDRFVADQFARSGGIDPPDHSVDDVLLRARRMRPLPRWLALIKEPPMRISSRVAVGSPTFRLASLMAITIALLVALGAAMVAGASLLPSPPPWTGCEQASCPAGTLTESRSWHSATLLRDGRVLVIGGASPGDIPATMGELWDPLTGVFEPAGTLNTPRLRHSATRLNDGRVLVVGGHDQTGIFDSAELWDPASRAFSVVGSLAMGRESHTATLLSDGRVLVIGGSTGGPASLDSAELFDPVTESFSPAGTLADARFWHSATLLPDDRVLVVGGCCDPSDLASAEVWDPASMSFSPTGSMAEARSGARATLLLDGRVLVAGGVTGPPWAWVRSMSTEAWSPDSGSFAPVGSLAAARGFFAATRLPDGRVLITGGADDASQPIGTAEVSNPDGSSFAVVGSLIQARSEHTETLLPDGQVLLVGGNGASDTVVLGSAELFDPDAVLIAPGSADPSPMR